MLKANTPPADLLADGGSLESKFCTSDTNSEMISPEQLKFREAISKSMSNVLAPLIAIPSQSVVRPTAYIGSKERFSDEGLLVAKRYLGLVYELVSILHLLEKP